MLSNFSGCQFVHLSFGNACFSLLMSSDVEHRTVYVVSLFLRSSTERVNSAREMSQFTCPDARHQRCLHG